MSLDPQIFSDGMKELRMHFGEYLPEGNPADKADLQDSYWGHLMDLPDELFQGAVNHLIETRTRRGKNDFPPVAAILEAAEYARELLGIKSSQPEEDCPKCLGMGRVVRNVIYEEDITRTPVKVALYCSCPAGTRLKEAHMRRYKKRKIPLPKTRLFRVLPAEEEEPEPDPY